MNQEFNIFIAFILKLLIDGKIEYNLEIYRDTVGWSDFVNYKSEVNSFTQELLEIINANSSILEPNNMTVVDKLAFENLANKFINNLNYSFTSLLKDFNNKKDKAEPLAYYHSTTFEFIPLVALGYLQNKDLIHSVDIKIKSPVEILEENIDDISDWFTCDIVFDASGLMQLSTIEDTTGKYSPQQQKMYDTIVDYVKANKYKIAEDEIRGILGIGYSDKEDDVRDTAVKVLNIQYREINNINDKKVRLINKRRNEYYYDILKDFKP